MKAADICKYYMLEERTTSKVASVFKIDANLGCDETYSSLESITSFTDNFREM